MALLNQESLDFIGKATEQTREVRTLTVMFDDPEGFAREHELEISPIVAGELSSIGNLRKKNDYSPDDKINQELLSFFNNVVVDGRYIKEWFDDPRTIAANLNLSVSEDVYARINEIDFHSIVDTDECFATVVPIVIHIVVEIVFIVISVLSAPPAYLSYAIQPIVVDRTNLKKV
ncbi:MAG: hypothetical protein IKZ52_01820 [Bacteroidales bacterium]|nr:hypothetical protein [Bacteroidales bacterium]